MGSLWLIEMIKIDESLFLYVFKNLWCAKKEIPFEMKRSEKLSCRDVVKSAHFVVHSFLQTGLTPVF